MKSVKEAVCSIAIMAASLFIVSCGNASSSNEPEFATDSLTYDKYSWFTWKAMVPQGKGYVFSEEMPETLKEIASTHLGFLVGDKVVINFCDFEAETLEEEKAIIMNNALEKEKKGIKDTKIAGRNAFMVPYLLGGSELTLYGYTFYVDFKDFSEGGFGGSNIFYMTVYPADGQADKIDELLNDEEVKFVLDNMTITPKK